MTRQRTIVTSLIVAIVLAAVVVPVEAITYGQADGNSHPNVGALIAEWREPGVREALCSGPLIARPTSSRENG